MFVPERSFHPSFSHVSWPVSPGRGTLWNVHFNLPVTASKPRVSPGVLASCGVSSVLAPRASTLRKTTGTPLHPTPARSATPFWPNPADGLPVAASSATR